MNVKGKLHHAQVSVLHYLRHQPEARYSQLMRTTSLDSDVFKFHVRKLISEGLLEKTPEATYRLTPTGKEYANRIDEKGRREIVFPKTSILIVLSCEVDDQTYYLIQHRKRDPFSGYWGMLSGPLVQGEPLLEAAEAELMKQAGISADLKFRGTIRTIDKNEYGIVLEDKLFAVVNCTLSSLEVPHKWHGGDTAWMTHDELLSQKPLFPTTFDVFKLLDTDERFIETVQTYSVDEY